MQDKEKLQKLRNIRSETWSLYPVFFRRPGNALIIGGGAVGTRKATNLLEQGWQVTVVSTVFSEELQLFSQNNESLKLVPGEKNEEAEDKNHDLVFCCTNNRDENRRWREYFQNMKIPVNCADDPEHSDFINGIQTESDHYTISVSSRGKNPGRLRELKERVQNLILDFEDEDSTEDSTE